MREAIVVAKYELTCASREPCDHGGHIVEVGLRRKHELQVVGIPVARLMLSSGDFLYAKRPDEQKRIGLQKGRCGCGAKTVRTETDDAADLEHIFPCH
jgi:hypothetical protein